MNKMAGVGGGGLTRFCWQIIEPGSFYCDSANRAHRPRQGVGVCVAMVTDQRRQRVCVCFVHINNFINASGGGGGQQWPP